MSSAAPPTPSLQDQCRQTAQRARRASAGLMTLDTAIKNQWLHRSAETLEAESGLIIDANRHDLDAAPGYGLSDAMIDRLRLDQKRIAGIASGLREVAALPDPIGEVLDGFVRPGGLEIIKRRVPLGVVFFIYESRPNVTADAAAICVKSGNAVILRGGKEAIHSSRAIVDLMRQAAVAVGVPESAVQLVATTERDAVGHFLKLDSLIDVTIPRGGEALIRRVASEATMPVIKHYDGNCHVYIDRHADADMAVSIVENSKCQRMGVCNACESLLIDEPVAESIFPRIARRLVDRGIEIRGDDRICALIANAKAATEDDWSAEYLGPVISVAVVDGVDAAIEHINRHGSGHTDAIVTGNLSAARRFTDRVDSSAVMVNASTRFNDGGMFGLGAEIGISTDKFHARGPCGLRELTTYKYVVTGDGNIRE